MLVLGVDPGTNHLGYAVLEREGATERLVMAGTLHLKANDDHQLRLKTIYEALIGLIETHLPDECAVEMPVYGRNAQSMLKLGRAQAAAMLAALNRGLPVAQYTPSEVKKAVTGNGAATKEQVATMVTAIVGEVSGGFDATDAVAVALCHLGRLAAPGGVVNAKAMAGAKGRKAAAAKGSWETFLKANPGRVTGGS